MQYEKRDIMNHTKITPVHVGSLFLAFEKKRVLIAIMRAVVPVLSKRSCTSFTLVVPDGGRSADWNLF